MSHTRWRRALLASAAALSLGVQDAWAVCSDGSTLPADGFVIGRDPQVAIASNWSPHVFTAAAGSEFVPDNSVHENNDPAKPLTHNGHNWVFDQGSTLCKVTDLGANADGTGPTTASWTIPPNNVTDCVVLPIIKNGTVTNLGDIPYQGSVITPTCNPAILSGAGPLFARDRAADLVDLFAGRQELRAHHAERREANDRLRVVGDQEGCPTSAPDLGEAILSIAAHIAADGWRERWAGLCHAAGTGWTTWHGLAVATFDAAARCGAPVPRVDPIATTEWPTRAKRPPDSRLDCDRLERMFGLRLPPWRDGLARTIDAVFATEAAPVAL
jgi:RmlD substrate binding domain